VETISIIFHDPKFWAALVLLANVLVYYFWPTFPVPIWTAIDGLLAVIFAAFTAKSTVGEKRARKLARGQ